MNVCGRLKIYFEINDSISLLLNWWSVLGVRHPIHPISRVCKFHLIKSIALPHLMIDLCEAQNNPLGLIHKFLMYRKKNVWFRMFDLNLANMQKPQFNIYITTCMEKFRFVLLFFCLLFKHQLVMCLFFVVVKANFIIMIIKRKCERWMHDRRLWIWLLPIR